MTRGNAMLLKYSPAFGAYTKLVSLPLHVPRFSIDENGNPIVFKGEQVCRMPGHARGFHCGQQFASRESLMRHLKNSHNASSAQRESATPGAPIDAALRETLRFYLEVMKHEAYAGKGGSLETNIETMRLIANQPKRPRERYAQLRTQSPVLDLSEGTSVSIERRTSGFYDEDYDKDDDDNYKPMSFTRRGLLKRKARSPLRSSPSEEHDQGFEGDMNTAQAQSFSARNWNTRVPREYTPRDAPERPTTPTRNTSSPWRPQEPARHMRTGVKQEETSELDGEGCSPSEDQYTSRTEEEDNAADIGQQNIDGTIVAHETVDAVGKAYLPTATISKLSNKPIEVKREGTDRLEAKLTLPPYGHSPSGERRNPASWKKDIIDVSDGDAGSAGETEDDEEVQSQLEGLRFQREIKQIQLQEKQIELQGKKIELREWQLKQKLAARKKGKHA